MGSRLVRAPGDKSSSPGRLGPGHMGEQNKAGFSRFCFSIRRGGFPVLNSGQFALLTRYLRVDSLESRALRPIIPSARNPREGVFFRGVVDRGPNDGSIVVGW